MSRVAFYTNESFAKDVLVDGERTLAYILAKVTEDEPGYVGHTTGLDLEGLQKAARQMNEENGLSDQDVADIIASSMRTVRRDGL